MAESVEGEEVLSQRMGFWYVTVYKVSFSYCSWFFQGQCAVSMLRVGARAGL